MPLNKGQREAVEAPFKPTLVIAGAGTGKTTVLIERILRYIDEGIEPSRILAITFTNKSKDEISHRIRKRSPVESSPRIYTFHAFFYWVLRKDIGKLGRDKDFRVIDENDQRAIFRMILKEKSIDSEGITPRTMANIVSILKHRNPYEQPLERNEVALHFSRKYELSFEDLADVYNAYEKNLREINVLDYDDLEILANNLLNIEEARKYWNQYFKAILIDEFQDTNDIQFEIVKKILGEHQNLFCVGDPDQSIYGFRGAKAGICREFLDTFEDTQLVKLEENYRSTQNILNVSNVLINKNSGELSKVLFTSNEEGSKVVYREFINEWDEVNYVLDEVQYLIKREGASLRDFAILYRNNFLAVPFEMKIKEKKWEYSITNSVEFYSREEIRAVAAYLHLVFNDDATDALYKIRALPPKGIGEVAVRTFETFKAASSYTVLEALFNIDECPELTTRAKTAFKELGVLIGELRSKKDLGIYDLIMFIIDKSGYKKYLMEKKELGRIENIIKFAEILKSDKGADNWEVVKEIPLKTKDVVPKTDDYILLSTVHQVKGLEFKYVFVVKMVSDVFPSYRSITAADKSEERRLAYVAFTRAKKRLYITKSPYSSKGSIVSNRESEFVTDIKGLPFVDARVVTKKWFS
ncbi:ATP-dependent DNA helicase UvrD/PcrA [Mycoplasma haemofelis str. Langford 1]|uniref:DNA 3'-5' helicase n=1 Tax=Mycoplasma haemofelis (strain Langford 1) TaxID=941640 RepID=E8ZJG5_MYCHL|nr:ATP-dependent helicase [Mycoplasma haemofelis]CBY93286.1 ATP-dependent DNA helicase UvrD/PcrA [Mycoplasma haemofelis str. Langford 1]